MDKHNQHFAPQPRQQQQQQQQANDLRQRFMQDQQLYASLGYLPGPQQTAQQQHGGGGNGGGNHHGPSGSSSYHHNMGQQQQQGSGMGHHQQTGYGQQTMQQQHGMQQQQQAQPSHGVDFNAIYATANAGGVAEQAPQMGWGGQVLADQAGYRVPWFGRSRAKSYPRQRGGGKDDGKPGGGPGGRGPWDNTLVPPAPPAAMFHKAPEEAMSVEEIVSLIQKLPKGEALPEKAFRALYHLDSRAVSLLLKDLSRVGMEKRAIELFDWLRGLPERHVLRALCDVYTFTAMVSLCIYQQDVDRALELVEDMRQRNIERNVHTYTALMNVCIKCGKLALAIDIFNSMKNVHVNANVVTYNTLVDVHGKLGQWEKALQVIDVMKSEGVEPVLRTYNTLIIACNMCNQPREALGVFHRLLTDGFTPNSTTFNALISAYGKTSQLDKALEVYQEMLRQNMDRSVITYSSLISACERAGKWETALKIFSEMQKDGCAPNTVTYNSLITACGQGGQWEKAHEVYEKMSAHHCTPDVVTYTALISAFERGGQWQRALQAFHQMCLQGCKPDAIVYNAIIDTLWETGIVWAQTKALALFRSATAQGQFRQEAIARKNGRIDLNLHAMTAGVAMLSLYCWLQDIKRVVSEKGVEHLPAALAVVTDVGKASREQGNCIVKEAVSAMMAFWEAPFRPVQDHMYAAVLEAPGAVVAAWVMSEQFTAQLASLFPVSEATSKLNDETYAAREAQVSSDCADAFSSVQHFESTHGLVLHNMSPAYVAQRPQLISRLLDISSKLALRDEVVHDSVLLLDRTASQAKQVPEDVLQLVGVAAMVIAAKQGDNSDNIPSNTELERLTDFPATAVAKMEWNIRGLLTDDTSAISTMRCLKIYLERLGYRFLDKQGVYGIAGFAIMLAVESLYDLALLNCRPSVVAAAILYSERRLRGAVPFWPSMLSRLTGYHDMSTPELLVAVRIAQKLSRKLVYAQMYKAQLTALSGSGEGAAAARAVGSGGAAALAAAAVATLPGPSELLPLPPAATAAAAAPAAFSGCLTEGLVMPVAAAVTSPAIVKGMDSLTSSMQNLLKPGNTGGSGGAVGAFEEEDGPVPLVTPPCRDAPAAPLSGAGHDAVAAAAAAHQATVAAAAATVAAAAVAAVDPQA